MAPQQKTVVLNVKVTPKMRVALAKAAARQDQTSSDIVRKLLTEFLRAEGLMK
jgi:hypothetical protein